MDKNEWNKILDRYLVENTMTPDEYESLEYERQYVIQELKKAFKRINSKNYDKEL